MQDADISPSLKMVNRGYKDMSSAGSMDGDEIYN